MAYSDWVVERCSSHHQSVVFFFRADGYLWFNSYGTIISCEGNDDSDRRVLPLNIQYNPTTSLALFSDLAICCLSGHLDSKRGLWRKVSMRVERFTALRRVINYSDFTAWMPLFREKRILST